MTPLHWALKRFIDILVSGLVLLIISPCLLLLAVLVRLTSPGPAIYRGRRVGRYGKIFLMFKFRSMIEDAERQGGAATANGDPRVTRMGAFLRRFKLDELPQFWNVLRGDMSLVGPRPEVPDFVALYSGEERSVLAVRPGITDWASIWDIDEGKTLEGRADPEEAYRKLILPLKLRLQMHYVRNSSLSMDLRILAHTALRILNRNHTPRELQMILEPLSRRDPSCV